MARPIVPAAVDPHDAATAVSVSAAASFALRLDIRGDALPPDTRRAAIEAASFILAASGFDVDQVTGGRLAREAWGRSGLRLQGPLAEAGAAFSIAQMAAASVVHAAQPGAEFELILRETALQ